MKNYLLGSVSSTYARWYITNANAKPIIPKVLRKSKNCMINVLVNTGSFGDDCDDGMSFPVKLQFVVK